MKMAQSETQETAVVDVLAPIAVDTLYSYRVPHGLALEPGDSVTIPLGVREAYGVVWDCRTAPLQAAGDLKSVSTRLDRPRLSQQLRDFIDWLARYTLTPRGMALRLATRAAEDAAPDALRTLYRVTGAPVRRLSLIHI